MNRITRMLTVTGLGLFTGLTISAGPAMAAANTGQAAVKSSTVGATTKASDRPAGHFDSRTECNIAGHIGDRLGRWDDYSCVPTGDGWLLLVDYNNWDNDNNWHGGHNWHGGFPGDFHGDHGDHHGDHGDHHGDHGDHGGDHHGGDHHGGDHHHD